MADVIGCILGGAPRRLQAESIADLREQLGVGSDYRLTVNGEEVGMDFVLSDEDFVSAAPGVKGGR